MTLKTTGSAASPGRQATLTYNVAVAAGDFIIVESQTAEVYCTVADSFGSTWSSPVQNTQSNMRQSVTWTVAAQSGTDTITVTTGNGLYPEMLVLVFSGISSVPADGSPAVTFPATAGTLTGGNITPTHNGDLLIGFVTAQNMTSFTQVGANNIAVSLIGTGGSPCGTVAVYRNISGLSAVNLQVTCTNSNAPENAVFATFLFKAAAFSVERGGITADQIQRAEKSGPGKLATYAGLLTKGHSLTVSDDNDIVDSGVSASGGIPQTPWTSNHDAATFGLYNAKGLGLGIVAASADLNSLLHLYRVPSAAAQPQILIDAGGVGKARISTIQASTPGRLDLMGNLYFDGAFKADDTTLSSFLLSLIPNTAGNGGGAVQFRRCAAGTANPRTMTTDITIDSSGNVGIGGTPAYKVDVAGDVNVTGVFRQNGTPLATGGGVTTQNIYNSGQRVLNTVYRNTTGKAMWCCLSLVLSGTLPLVIAYSDSSTNPSTIVGRASNANANGAIESQFCFVVLAGNYYQVASSGGASCGYWNESY